MVAGVGPAIKKRKRGTPQAHEPSRPEVDTHPTKQDTHAGSRLKGVCMRFITGVLVVTALALPVCAQGQAVSAPSKADVQKLMQDRDETRHKGDWAAYAQFFTSDATVINSDGKSYKGRAQIQKSAEEMWGGGVYKGARMKTTVETVEAIAANVAIADASFEITNIPGGGSRKGRTTVVLVKSNGGWKIAASRSMVPTPTGALRTSH